METLDVKFFKPFVDGMFNTMKVQCATEMKAGKPFYKGESEEPPFVIAAILGVTSPTFTGTISIWYTKPVYLGLVSRMLGENFSEITKDLEDGAAEILNIIFGHAKRVLNGQGYTLHMAIPSVLRGEGLSSKHISDSPTIVLPFICDLGTLYLEICTMPEQKSLI